MKSSAAVGRTEGLTPEQPRSVEDHNRPLLEEFYAEERSLSLPD